MRVPEGQYVLTIGETMALMKAEQPGPLAHTSTMSLGIGGSESNVAIGLQRLGIQTVWCSRLGDDPLGPLITREIRAEGVDVRATIDPGASTGLMIKERRTVATQRVTYYRSGSAASRITPDDVAPELINNAALLHVSGITGAISHQAAATVHAAVDSARAAGVPVSFDLNYRANLWTSDAAAEFYRQIIPKTDIVFGGEDEAAIAVGTAQPADLAARLTAFGPAEAIIKLGSDGAIGSIDGSIYRQDSLRVNVIDSVGAGDAFVAGYLAERLTDCPPTERMRTATVTGAFACLVPGDWEGFPRRSELGLLECKDPVTR